jgi:signal transduction histidine kinase
LLTIPLLLVLLSCGGYFFATLATRPIEQTFSFLREFMINAGHELKTPITVTQAVLDNLNREGADPKQLPQKLAAVSVSINRMKDLVDDMSLLARLEADKSIKQVLHPVTLHQVVKDSVEHLRPLFERQGISLNIATLSQCVVLGNASALHRMVTNLLNNALAYNKPQGSVSVNLSQNGRFATLLISDTGIGISPEVQPRIFDRFFRAEESRSRETGGSGLGLAIVKAIVEAHNGTIAIDSKLSAGTTIYVNLPCSN